MRHLHYHVVSTENPANVLKDCSKQESTFLVRYAPSKILQKLDDLESIGLEEFFILTENYNIVYIRLYLHWPCLTNCLYCNRKYLGEYIRASFVTKREGCICERLHPKHESKVWLQVWRYPDVQKTSQMSRVVAQFLFSVSFAKSNTSSILKWTDLINQLINLQSSILRYGPSALFIKNEGLQIII
ncbi:MAG: hypothetical protein EZS28_022436 [Streblomastix strix]|uniref:Uncharacterized protein n=1 Tax=Streblomastix strix TaxID=222440 RepID=A0A5J4VHR5_9EUKA|nr:MAG: hypothetical protein EZS28_022436 [Streblomastix strix]